MAKATKDERELLTAERDALRLQLARDKATYETMLKGMESQAEVGHSLKQENRTLTAERDRLLSVEQTCRVIVDAIEPWLVEKANLGQTGILASKAVPMILAERDELQKLLMVHQGVGKASAQMLDGAAFVVDVVAAERDRLAERVRRLEAEVSLLRSMHAPRVPDDSSEM